MTHIFDVPFTKLGAAEDYRAGFLLLNLFSSAEQVHGMATLVKAHSGIPLYGHATGKPIFSAESIAVIRKHGSYAYKVDGVNHARVAHVGYVPEEFSSQLYGCVAPEVLQVILQNWSPSPPAYDRAVLDAVLASIVDGCTVRFWTLEWEHPYWDYANELFSFGEDAESLRRLIT